MCVCVCVCVGGWVGVWWQGLCMAELLADGQSSVDLTPFAPTRFMTRAGGRGRRNVTQAVGEQW
jgi:hypothetical protein